MGFFEFQTQNRKNSFSIAPIQCPHCLGTTFSIEELGQGWNHNKPETRKVIWPLSSGKPPAPPEVPENIADDYNESSIVLPFSAKASAALSRRCLQAVLGDEKGGGSKERNLSDQIEDVVENIPSYIGNNLDYVREIGNFAAHEQKSKNSGLILYVEPGEAEWNLEVLDALFDFYYVKPAIEEKKRIEFNKKLEEAGRRPLQALSEEDNAQETS